MKLLYGFLTAVVVPTAVYTLNVGNPIEYVLHYKEYSVSCSYNGFSKGETEYDCTWNTPVGDIKNYTLVVLPHQDDKEALSKAVQTFVDQELDEIRHNERTL